MGSIVSGAFVVAAIFVLFPGYAVAACAASPTSMQTARSGGANHLTDPDQRAACSRESMERQQRG